MSPSHTRPWPGPRTVVGVAVLLGGRVLAAERAEGGWELPGGKAEPGEDDAATAVREVREELGLDVRVLGPLPGEEPVRVGLVLRVQVAVPVVLGEPALVVREHRGVRWVGPDELDGVDWLPPDRPFVPVLRALLLHGPEEHFVAGFDEPDEARAAVAAATTQGAEPGLRREGFAGEDDSDDRPWLVEAAGPGACAALRLAVEDAEHAWFDTGTAGPGEARPAPLPDRPVRLKRGPGTP